MEILKRKNQIYKVTLIGSIANLALVVLKLGAGIVGRSGAMVADAVHSLSDLATDIIVMVFVKLSSKPQDKEHAWGHGKFETLATAVVGLILLVVGAGILWEGISRIWQVLVRHELIERPEPVALYAAVASIVVKEWLFRYTRAVARRVNSPLVEANAWHHRSDAFSSIGTLVGIAGAIFLGPRWAVLDPIAAAVVSLFIIKVAVDLMTPSMNDLLERSLPDAIQQEILAVAAAEPEVKDPHNLRTRRIGTNFAIELHVRVRPDMQVSHAHMLTSDIERKLKEKYGPGTYVIVHIEPIK